MPAQYLRFGPFSLETLPPQLRRGTEQIALRPKSLALLRYLAERPGRLVGKEELLQSVWSGRAISQDGLRGCVREIRAALGDRAETPQYLETIVGRGYRFLEGRDGRRPFPETAGLVVGRASERRQLNDKILLLLYLIPAAQAAVRTADLIANQSVGVVRFHFSGSGIREAFVEMLQFKCYRDSFQLAAYEY